MDEIASLRRQLKKLHENLLKIEEQEVEFIDPGGIPPDLEKAKKSTLDRISEVKRRLSQLTSQSQGELVNVPFVVVAMTKQEASDLINEAIFKSDEVAPSEYARFQQIKKIFRKNGLNNWLAHYDEDRENWRPHTNPENTIHEIILEVVATINQSPLQRDTVNLPLITPQLYSEQFFAEDEIIQEETWRRLSTAGCVVIIDAISLFHPRLNQILADSQMSSKENVALLLLSPINPTISQAQRLLEKEMRLRMRLAFARFDRHLDKLCEIGVGDLRAFNRWLFAILPELATNTLQNKPNAANLERLSQVLGEEPSGFGPADFMSWGGGQ